MQTWHFDGHGINDTNGTRIAKVQHERGPQFDADSKLIAKAPELFAKAKEFVAIADTIRALKGTPGAATLDELHQVINEHAKTLGTIIDN